MAKLNDKQQKFVEEYLIDLNATQAAIRAGYSSKTAKEQGARLLTNANILGVLERALAERSRRTGINQDRIVNELAKIAFVKITDVADKDGKIKTDADEEDLACIESIKVKRSSSENGCSEEREVKLASKMKALELLGKHLGMWNDKLNINLNLPVFYEGEDNIEE